MSPNTSDRSGSGCVLVVAALVLAAIGVMLLHIAAHHGAPNGGDALSPSAGTAPPAAPAVSAAKSNAASPDPGPADRPTPSSSATGVQLPPPGSGPAGDAAIQHALDAALPPDLPAATARQLVALGQQVWTAEATGAERARWPGYFAANSAVGAVYTRFRIQAAIARRNGTDPNRAVVHLVWAGADPGGQFLDDRTATITLERRASTWLPIR